MAFTNQQARRLVLNYTGAQAGRDDVLIAKVVERMVTKGECVWHALSEVTGKPCWCGACRPKHLGARRLAS